MVRVGSAMTSLSVSLCRSLWAGLVLACFSAGLRAAPFTGAAIEVSSDVQHLNGNVYDQLLLQGASATIGADAGQITRISFIDVTDDIIQVEFAGAGQLTLSVVNSSPPAAPVRYNQPGVLYMRGHASITITGSDSTTSLSIYSLGKETMLNTAILRDDVIYDGWADIASIHIISSPVNAGGAAFGSIRAGNVHLSGRSGDVGIYAPSVHVQGVVVIGDVSAFDDAIPRLWFGTSSQFGALVIAGGDLLQPNGRLIQIHYPFSTSMFGGKTSAGIELPAQPMRGQLHPAALTP